MSYLENLNDMPADLRKLYQLRADFNRTLANFRAWWATWKASILNDSEDEQAADVATACWNQLRALRKRIVEAHRKLGFSEDENQAFELPFAEYEERIRPEVEAPAPARMDPAIRKLFEGMQ